MKATETHLFLKSIDSDRSLVFDLSYGLSCIYIAWCVGMGKVETERAGGGEGGVGGNSR